MPQKGTVPDLTIRPTSKFLKAGTILASLVFLALEIWCLKSLNELAGTPLIMLAPLLILLWPAARAIVWQSTKITVSGDRLRYETGILSKSTRTIQLSKVQNVRVDQGPLQRIFNIGDLSIETAGETSRLTILNVDAPQALADEVMNWSQAGSARGI
jgi:membrane protein YdbS with pleckstrin-like domain